MGGIIVGGFAKSSKEYCLQQWRAAQEDSPKAAACDTVSGTFQEPIPMPTGELILYQSEDGKSEVQLRAEDGTVWLSQAEMAELFQTTPQNITLHLKGIFGDGELVEGATCKELLQVRLEGDRDVRRAIRLYNLDVILSVGYRVSETWTT